MGRIRMARGSVAASAASWEARGFAMREMGGLLPGATIRAGGRSWRAVAPGRIAASAEDITVHRTFETGDETDFFVVDTEQLWRTDEL